MSWTSEELVQTCYIEFYLQCDLIGQRRVTKELIGFLQRSIFCGNSIDWQEAVSNLQQATPTTTVTMLISEREKKSFPYRFFLCEPITPFNRYGGCWGFGAIVEVFNVNAMSFTTSSYC